MKPNAAGKAKATEKQATREHAAMKSGLARLRSLRLNRNAEHAARATVAAIRRAKPE